MKRTYQSMPLSPFDYVSFALLLPYVGVVDSSTTGSSAISNQLEAGSIIVRHIKTISVLSYSAVCMDQYSPHIEPQRGLLWRS